MICKDMEQDLALAAADYLDTSRSEEIRRHCANCPDCAARLEQYRWVSSDHLQAAKELDGLGLRHDHAAAGVRQSATSPERRALNPVLRWLLPIGAVALLAAAFFMKDQPVQPERTRTEPALVRPAQEVSVDRAPTLAAYRKALDQSGEASLDALLTRDADRLLRKTPGQETRNLLSESF